MGPLSQAFGRLPVAEAIARYRFAIARQQALDQGHDDATAVGIAVLAAVPVADWDAVVAWVEETPAIQTVYLETPWAVAAHWRARGAAGRMTQERRTLS